ncbi:unnamed protein product [Owenia fusiformis]|uniref:Uncharacterized protein n=1 Tax=Owenia fusiformis TaxID=6347 RepID=A0A8J1Y264_OWEFU|nr:unnamed protein product [Owenia fusiformis]
MTDQVPIDESSVSKIWIFEGTRSDRLLQFSNLENLNNNITESIFTMPFECMGTGSLVANGRIYCHIYGTKYMMQCSLNTGSCVERALPDIGIGPDEEYSLNGLNNFIDFQHTEQGIWVLYASIFNSFNVIIERIDPVNLTVIERYESAIPKRLIGNAFIVCSDVYGIERADGTSSYVSYKYDRIANTTTSLSRNQLPFNHTLGCGSSAWITQLSYNWVAERLLVWNCGIQEMYDLTFVK